MFEDIIEKGLFALVNILLFATIMFLILLFVRIDNSVDNSVRVTKTTCNETKTICYSEIVRVTPTP